MISVRSLIIHIFCLASMFMTFACSKSEVEWKGTIEEVDGVTVIKNPKEPLYGEINFELEKDLSIGREDDENYMFYRVRGVALDSEENIFVLDRGNYRIQKFDKKGKYLQTIGRKGQGPGELETALGFFLDSKNNIYVDDFRKIDRFNKQGQFIECIPLNIYINDFAVGLKGSIVVNGWIREKGGVKRMISTINSDGKTIRKIAEFSGFGPKIIITSNATWTLAPNRVYRPLLLFAPLDERSFVYGYSSEYQIIKIDINGNLILKIQKEENFHTISRREKDFIIERDLKTATESGMKVSKKTVEEACYFRKYRPFFNKFIIDNKQRLFIQRVKSVLDESEQIDFDIFSNEGYYLYRANLPFSPEIIQKGYLYDIYTSEETGEVKIYRYKVKNWKQIKEGI